MTRSSPFSGNSSSNSESAGSDAGDSLYSELPTTRRRYLAITGVGLSTATAGCTSTGSDGSTSNSETSEPTDETSDDTEVAETGTESDEDETETNENEPEEDEPETIDDLPLFDAHTHVIPTEARGRDPLFAEQLVEWMDTNSVDRAIVLAFDAPEAYPVQAPSGWVLDEVDSYPDRLVPFCTVDPRDSDGTDAAADRLEHYIDRGARGFGELKIEMDIDDDRLEPLYERCATYELPILFHTDRQMMQDEVGLPRLEDVLASYPKADFVAHAHGWWSHMSADVGPQDLGRIPEGPIEAPGRVWDLLAEYDNIYGDISTLGGWNALTRDEAYGQAFLESHHDQLLFGTDYLFPGHQIPHFALFEQFDLELNAWADIRYRNIENLLR
ncbi:amidohydrolase family protein [Natronococcus sp. A-GB7]|uniref:amidohydrolase family protein n=1 Tax=Natronococcus sp. A-GB7 TaxID=3037649 RepID=UPI00241CE1E6|nr:amidohydrolase family protein [Natronococcus sp. A-GB7]MDG5820810.1 amidohydrolase family protein [Natronococcus sp. A-GB7]